MKKISILTTALLVLFVSIYPASCATIATGTTQLVTITCNVESVDVKLDDILVGETKNLRLINLN